MFNILSEYLENHGNLLKQYLTDNPDKTISTMLIFVLLAVIVILLYFFLAWLSLKQ